MVWRTASMAFVAILMMLSSQAPARANLQVNPWTAQERVPNYAVDTTTPLLLTDSSGVVHALNSQLVDDIVAILYRTWTPSGGWSDPVDVLIAPVGQARLSGAFIDLNGILHVAFFGGDGERSGVMYSRAHISQANRASSWSQPLLVGEFGGPLTHGTLAGDQEGNLYILYNGHQSGNGLYVAHSSDAGVSWSKPVAVSLTNSSKHMAAYISSHVDTKGQVHAVWTLANDSGNGDAIYYARLGEDHITWSTPVILAAKTEENANTASVIEHNGEIIVVYHNDTPPVRYFRRSPDGGNTWTDPVRAFEGWEGSNGPAVLLHDSANNLHALFGNRTPSTRPQSPAIHGMWHSTWQGDRWGPVQPVVSGPQVKWEQGMGFDPSFAQAAISLGQELLVVWTTDPQGGANGVWYSRTTLNVPAIAAAPVPTAIVTPAPTPTPKAIPTLPPRATVAPAPVATRWSAPSDRLPDDGGVLALAASIVPAALAVAAVTVVSIWRSRRLP